MFIMDLSILTLTVPLVETLFYFHKNIYSCGKGKYESLLYQENIIRE